MNSPWDVIPISGMIIGGSMIACGLTKIRARDEIISHAPPIKAAFALGASVEQAGRGYLRLAVETGIFPSIDFLKTAGLVSIPGVLLGMLLADTPPLEAVQQQLIVPYLYLSALVFTSLAAAYLTQRQAFTRYH